MIFIKSIRIRVQFFLTGLACLCILLCIAVFLMNDGYFVSVANLKDGPQETAYTNQNTLTAFLTIAKERPSLEIFDVKAEKVVKKIDIDTAYKKAAEKFLGSINGVYTKVNAFPRTGCIVRVPLLPAVTVHNKWINGDFNEVFILFPQDEKPYLLVLDDKDHPLFYNFDGNTEDFLKRLDYQPV